MTEKLKDMMDDDRTIREIRSADGCDPVARVGRYGVTKIVAYGERGEYGYIPFFAVYVGEEIAQRWPGAKCSVFYGETEEW